MNLDQLRALFRGENAEKIRSKLEELDQLDAQIAELTAKRHQLDFELSDIIGGTTSARQPRQSAVAGRRNGVRDEVFQVVSDNPEISPSQIREKLGIAATDKSGAQSVANAISALKRDKRIREAAPRQYIAA